jgi:hypothetical protein
MSESQPRRTDTPPRKYVLTSVGPGDYLLRVMTPRSSGGSRSMTSYGVGPTTFTSPLTQAAGIDGSCGPVTFAKRSDAIEAALRARIRR